MTENYTLKDKITDLNILGYTIINNVIKENEIISLLNKINQINKNNTDSDERTQTECINNIYCYDKYFLDILNIIPNFHEIIKNALDDPYKEEYNYNLLQYNARNSGKKDLNVHIDSIVPYLGDKCFKLNVLVYLEDSNVNSGCTLVVPGSHKSGKYTVRDYKNTIPIEAKKGDVIIFDSRLWHAAKAKTSNISRWALVLTIGAWWIKPVYDIINSIPKNIEEKLSKQQLKFLGYDSIPPKASQQTLVTSVDPINQIKNLWEEEVYKKNKQINKYPYTSVVSNIFNFTKNREDKKILDIGCGTGNNLKFFAENGFNCYGIDISTTAVDICKKFIDKSNLKADVIVGESHKLSYENNCFDVVVDRASITHNSYNFEKCIKEVYRVLKKDGIFITELFGKNTTDKKYGEKINDNLYVNFKEGHFKDSDVFLVSFEDIKIYFKDFEILQINEINQFDHIKKKNLNYFEIVFKKSINI